MPTGNGSTSAWPGPRPTWPKCRGRRTCCCCDEAPEPGRGRVVAGDAGFHGQPDENGRVELGYMVLSPYRRQGLAAEAVRALLAWAVAEQGVTRFQACINPDNIPSVNLIRKLGFSQVGRQLHESRGQELIFHLDSSASTGRRANWTPG